ncbi:hypothetical protein APHAL10511_005791 [Amanita phalloides]|nr:hypothetical protein APHAL10511_005791 [Amanita phalloides]
MKFTVFLSTLLALSTPVLTTPVLTTVTVAYDQTYDSGSLSLNNVACSDGANGLVTRGYSTFDSLPGFPYIGAAYAVTGWNSSACGSCWSLTYNNGQTSKNIYITAIDRAGADSFNIALSAMNELTNNQAVQLGRVDVTAVQVAPSYCGFK